MNEEGDSASDVDLQTLEDKSARVYMRKILKEKLGITSLEEIMVRSDNGSLNPLSYHYDVRNVIGAGGYGVVI
jgi:hypothetical protein